MDFYSYEKDGFIVRPVAADFMRLELQLEGFDIESFNIEEFISEDSRVTGTAYDIEEEEKPSDEKRQEMSRRTDIDNLRKFLIGKYVFEEGETLAAFDEVECEYNCASVFSYIQSLDDYNDVFDNWTLDDASLWVLDIADWHFGVLNAAEIFMVVNMMMEDMCRRNSF